MVCSTANSGRENNASAQSRHFGCGLGLPLLPPKATALQAQTGILKRDILPLSSGMIPLRTGQMAIDVGRRQFISTLGGAALAWPMTARAQQPALPVIGFLHSEAPGAYASQLRGFHQGLSEAGFVEGRNVAVEYRWAESHYDRLPALAADLVARRVAVIASNGPAVKAAKTATATMPIVFFVAGDPVQLGLVASLARPGGNLTGITNLGVELGPKRLELLHELVPAATSFAALVNPASPGAGNQSEAVQAAARALSVQLAVLNASTEADFDTVFAKLAELRAGGLVIVTDPLFNTRQEQLAALAARRAVPTIYQNREFTAAGGLASYGASSEDLWRKIGAYAGRIVKGEKPANLPVQQPTKFELIINLKTAKALGLTVPATLQAAADEVIE
jgi:putative tryptophan/tyrosine transport system substrate-binding protein